MEEFGGPYPRPFTRDFDAWSRAVTPARIDELRRDGFTVVDDFLGGGGADGDDGTDAGSSPSPSNNGDAWALALREEIEWLSSKDGVMRPNRTHFANPKGERFLFAKPGIAEADMHDDSVAALVPELRAFFEAASTAFADAFDPAKDTSPSSDKYAYELSKGHGARTVKLQVNDGTGGCFPTHYDNPGPPSKRALTCILYLNPHWVDGHGGELDLMPFCATPVRVAAKARPFSRVSFRPSDAPRDSGAGDAALPDGVGGRTVRERAGDVRAELTPERHGRHTGHGAVSAYESVAEGDQQVVLPG